MTGDGVVYFFYSYLNTVESEFSYLNTVESEIVQTCSLMQCCPLYSGGFRVGGARGKTKKGAL